MGHLNKWFDPSLECKRNVNEAERDGFMKCNIFEVCMHHTVCHKTPTGDHAQQRLQNNVGRAGGMKDLFLIFLFLFSLLVLFLPGSLDNRCSNPVQVTLAILANSSSAVFSLFQDTNVLQCLADFSLDSGGGICVM